ncbi:T9SS type A sorting domain-containing protein [Bernardetia sp. OM2101]|uniref:T9SS type A sorting domain-containing protein n=1 Tax=Bernardetia sp. OM2101 TaxID=3344876 RepID=UPI0035CFC7DF
MKLLYFIKYNKKIFLLLLFNFIVIQLSAQNKALDSTNRDTTNFEAHILGESIQTSCKGVIELFAQEVENVSYYRWYLNDQPFDEGRNLITTVAGCYTLLVGKGNYNAISEEVIVKLNKKPLAKIAQLNKTHFCDNGILNADLINPNAAYKWILNDRVIGEETFVLVSESGIYTLQVTQNGCQASTEIEVFVSSTSPLHSPFLDVFFTTYPNPSKGFFNVKFPTPLIEDIQISIFDSTGKIVKKQIFEKNNQEFIINIQEFSKGMYLIRLNQNNSTYSKSIILE